MDKTRITLKSLVLSCHFLMLENLTLHFGPFFLKNAIEGKYEMSVT